jgi:carboxyl-terminal processing protease
MSRSSKYCQVLLSTSAALALGACATVNHTPKSLSVGYQYGGALVAQVVELVDQHYVTPPDHDTMVAGCIESLKSATAASGELPQPVPAHTSELSAYIEQFPTNAHRTGAPRPARLCIDGILRSLDAQDYLQYPEHNWVNGNKNLASIGLALSGISGIDSDSKFELMPLPGSPAKRAGVETGDRLTGIDGSPVTGWNLRQIGQALGGPVNSSVTLQVVRIGQPITLTVRVTRELPDWPEARAWMEPSVTVLEGERALYVRIPRIDDDSAGVMLAKIDHSLFGVAENSVRAIVIDLRGNGGGMLKVAVGIAATFLPNDALVVETRGRTPDDRATYKAQVGDISDSNDHAFKQSFRVRPALLKTAPLFILIDSGTSSGASAVAESLRHHRQAILIGATTSQSAKVRTIVPIKGTSERIVFATGQLYAPDGQCLDGRGIAPDIAIPSAPGVLSMAYGSDSDLAYQKALEIVHALH